jgi:hypothetical protein
VVGETIPFPERYFPLGDGSLLFLIDAEHPVRRDRRMVDLHARLTDGVEWELARNLEVRQWVLSSDSLSWAVAAVGHIADYGGDARDVVVAGRGGNVQTFELGDPSAVVWDDAGRLWILTRTGDLNAVTPAAGAWTSRRVDVSDRQCRCTPGDAESLWTWASPAPSGTPELASDRAREGLRRAGVSTAAWVAKVEGGFVPCWGGAFTRETLLATLGVPLEPGAEPRRIPVEGSTFLGPVARVHAPELGGVATLRRVGPTSRGAGELWWRFTGGKAAVRLAGPWGR